MNANPAHRVRPPRDRTITRRKQLAQEIRNELDSYRRRASDEGSQIAPRDRCLLRVDAKYHELLALEGFER